MKTLIAILLLSSAAYAENLHGINFMDSLGEVKQKYPHAIYKKEKPAWLPPSESFFTISGAGLPGLLKIDFSDGRPYFTSEIKKHIDDPDWPYKDSFDKQGTATDDEALSVNWVRWVPEVPIPIDRYKKKYGSPVCDFDSSMMPFCKWPLVGLDAQMSEDNKFVLFVTTNFTKLEKRTSYIKKFNWVPDELK